MMTKNEVKKEKQRIRKKSTLGCFLAAFLLILAPGFWVIGTFVYEMYLKETVLLSSDSPNRQYNITVVQKGSAFFFGPSTVRIKSGWKHIERSINNDGKTLDSSNVSITWQNDDEAFIQLNGEEQMPEAIKFSAQNFSKSATFSEEQIELGSFTFKTSESPNLINIIELREVTKSKGPSPQSSVRIYYGKRGGVLEKYKEYFPTEMYTPDNFEIDWVTDQNAIVRVLRENENGEMVLEKIFQMRVVN